MTTVFSKEVICFPKGGGGVGWYGGGWRGRRVSVVELDEIVIRNQSHKAALAEQS